MPVSVAGLYDEREGGAAPPHATEDDCELRLEACACTVTIKACCGVHYLGRLMATRDMRSGQPADQRYKSAYLFGAICTARGTGAALALPFADTEAMQLHINEISRHVEKGAHAVLVMDRAG
ncbi:transposase [Aminobacter sp. Y103A]|nr:transposase [Aminobacter sp. SS-2016]